MGEGRTRGQSGTLQIMVGLAAITAGVIVVALPEAGLAVKLLVLAGGLLAVGISKVSTARRSPHLTKLLRRFGIAAGILTIVVGAIVLGSTSILILEEFFPILGVEHPVFVATATLLSLGLLLIILAGGLVLYGIDRLLEGYSGVLPRRQRVALVIVGSASIALAVLALAFPTFGEFIVVLILVFALFSTGISAIVTGVYMRRTPTAGEPGPRPSVAPEREWIPEAKLHLLVVGKRRDIVESLRRLAHKTDLKLQQGALEEARRENLDEDLLFERLRAYVKEHGDVKPREAEEWTSIEDEFQAYQKKASRKKFQWLRPIGSLTSKVHVTRIAYVLRKTPLDLMKSGGTLSVGASLGKLSQALRQSQLPVSQEFLDRMDAEFSLLKGGLAAKGAYILHIVGLPVDVDSDELGDIYDDDALLLWDFGASHTEVGALDPADHLMSGTTNFLLGPVVLFQHFYDEGRPVALGHKRHALRVAWAGRRVVAHLSDAIDVELAFKRGEVTLPNPLARESQPDLSLPPEAIAFRTIRTPAEEGSQGLPEDEAWWNVGISGTDLRQEGFQRLDWSIIRSLLEPESMSPPPTPLDQRPYIPITSVSWLFQDWVRRTVDAMVHLLEIDVESPVDLQEKASMMDEARNLARVREGASGFIGWVAPLIDWNPDEPVLPGLAEGFERGIANLREKLTGQEQGSWEAANLGQASKTMDRLGRSILREAKELRRWIDEVTSKIGSSIRSSRSK